MIMGEWSSQTCSVIFARLVLAVVVKGKPLVCLDIPYHYELMQPELIKLLKERTPEYLRLSTVEK